MMDHVDYPILIINIFIIYNTNVGIQVFWIVYLFTPPAVRIIRYKLTSADVMMSKQKTRKQNKKYHCRRRRLLFRVDDDDQFIQFRIAPPETVGSSEKYI